ncbi:hypothetical protein E1286_09075 [Nonomuraea terrae]|uniref:Uncharacterized protein n=1 Tax=Nonomuraea terrae TaxID=2530383 RepID=A0A4R4Z4J3_9ACTN|nr:hypothetical protein [Nonomuraea terrae]TDD52350.1 hypothetical protein E1286_09075 [Nonomuraea terrae]
MTVPIDSMLLTCGAIWLGRYNQKDLIYQHAVRGADEAITNAIDRQLEARDDDDDKGTAGALVPAG